MRIVQETMDDPSLSRAGIITIRRLVKSLESVGLDSGTALRRLWLSRADVVRTCHEFELRHKFGIRESSANGTRCLSQSIQMCPDDVIYRVVISFPN